MPNDKLVDLTPVDVTFFPGERPTDIKLEGMMSQAEQAIESVESAIGDAFGESLQDENVWISNFSRDIGDRDLLNPILTPDVEINSYAQTLTLGKNEHELDLIPVGNGSSIISSSSDSSVVPGQFKSTAQELVEEGDWTILPGRTEDGIEKNSRKLITHSCSNGQSVIFSQVTSGRGSAYSGARHNTIPSVVQANAGGPFCSVAVSDQPNNIYTFTLPAESNSLNQVYEDVTPSLSNTAAGVGAGQQLKLPEYLFDASALDMGSDDITTGQGQFFPGNIIRIYDWQEKKVVDGLLSVQASPLAASRRFEIICQFRADISIDEVSGQYLIVTSGVQLSNMVAALQREVFFHTHSGDDMLRGVEHSNLFGLRTGDVAVDRSRYYGPSSIDSNDHSMYLHRNGFDTLDIGGGGNILRGDLLVGSQDLGNPIDHEHHNLDDDSFAILFGSSDSKSGGIFFDKEREHNIPAGFLTIPSSFSDTAIVILGSVDDTSQLLRTTFIDGNLRVGEDVVLGTTESNNTIITGNLQTKDLTVTPSLLQSTSTNLSFANFSLTSSDLTSSSSQAHFNRVKIADGDVLEPGLAFEQDTDTGLYRSNTDDASLVSGGTEALRFNNTYVSSKRNHRFEDGSESIPAVSFNSDVDTGLYRPGEGSLSVSSNGTEHSRFDADGLLYTTATAAQYSDLAERYESDTSLSPGDVIKLGGTKEITLTDQAGDPDVFGVISTAPALMMNESAGSDVTHPFVALVGRVPCKVVGPVNKFERLIASDTSGVAMRITGSESLGGMIIGRALQNKESEGVELIEIAIGKF